jgi:hypothetical protein
VPVPEKASKVTIKSETKNINKTKPEKINAFDYQAWDRFDVVNKNNIIQLFIEFGELLRNYFNQCIIGLIRIKL